MPADGNRASEAAEGTRVRVWDPLVRVTHWTIAVLVLGEFTVFDDDWAIHRWAGYVVLGLVAVRLAWGLIGPRHARFSAFPPSLARARAYLSGLLRGCHPLYLSHNPLGALMAYNLWASLALAVATGYLAILRVPGAKLVGALHEVVANWILLSVALHVAGVLFDSWYSGVDLVRAMVSGWKTLPAEGDEIGGRAEEEARRR